MHTPRGTVPSAGLSARLITAGALTLVGLDVAHGQDAARMDQVVQSYATAGRFMGSVLVARGNEILLSKGYGAANLEWNVPNAPSTKFRLGSLTKQFTAAAILLLEEGGALRVDDPVKRFVPEAPTTWDAITIRHLLTHTSGIPNFTSFPDYRSLEPLPSTPAALVARFRDKPLDFSPGETFSYSNSGYVLLGYVIERITGVSYDQFLQDRLFTPLGMAHSGYDSHTAVIRNRASGYTPAPAGPVNAGFVHMSIPFAAGALYSTTEDLLRWERGLFGGKVLSTASLQKMTTPAKNDYAFGVGVRTTNGRRTIAHNGGIEGFSTFLAYSPETQVTVAVLANLNGPAADQLGAQLGALAHGEPVQLTTERNEIAVSRAVLATYVGTYELAPRINMMITLDDDRLMAQLSGQAKLQVYPETETRFFLKAVDAQLEFEKNDQGVVTAVVLHQNGRDQRAARTSDTVAERTEVSVAPAVLAAYAGTYALQPAGVDLVVTLEGRQLMAQITGQAKLPLFAESETQFFLKAVDAQIEFAKDGSGNVTHLTLHQGNRDIRATRR